MMHGYYRLHLNDDQMPLLPELETVRRVSGQYRYLIFITTTTYGRMFEWFIEGATP